MRTQKLSLVIGYSAVLVLGTTLAAGAAPPEKVSLCHWDDDAGVYEQLSVPAHAAARHVEQHEHDAIVGEGIGEGCVEEVAVAVLASASSVDSAGGPVSVARVMDTDGSGSVSVGDTVEVGRFPLGFDGGGWANATRTSHVVERVVAATPGVVQVQSSGATFAWVSTAAGAGMEMYLEVWGSGTTSLLDRTGGSGWDDVTVRSGSPSGPDAGGTASASSGSDDAFLDVAINAG